MDRAVDPAAAGQRLVRGIDDGVDRQRGDVALQDFDRHGGLGHCPDAGDAVSCTGIVTSGKSG